MFTRLCIITIPLIDQRDETKFLDLLIPKIKSGLRPAAGRYISDAILHIVVDYLERLFCRDQWEIPQGPVYFASVIRGL